MRVSKKRFIYLISPNKIKRSFYSNLKVVLSSNLVGFFQLRLKQYSLIEKKKIGIKIKKICKKYKVKLIVNDDPNLTKKIGADGCHLGQNDINIQEARKTPTKQNYKTSKDEVLNSDELAERNRKVGASVSQQQREPVETIVRERPKIGRNEKVKVKNIKTGEIKTIKFKKAEILVKNGE